MIVLHYILTTQTTKLWISRSQETSMEKLGAITMLRSLPLSGKTVFTVCSVLDVRVY